MGLSDVCRSMCVHPAVLKDQVTNLQCSHIHPDSLQPVITPSHPAQSARDSAGEGAGHLPSVVGGKRAAAARHPNVMVAGAGRVDTSPAGCMHAGCRHGQTVLPS